MATHKARKWHRFILKKKKKDLYFNFMKGFFTFTWKLKWSSIYGPIYLLLILRQVGRCIPCSAAFDFNFQIVLNYLQMRKDQNIYIKYLLKITFVLPAQILSRSSSSLWTLLTVYLAVKGFFFLNFRQLHLSVWGIMSCAVCQSPFQKVLASGRFWVLGQNAIMKPIPLYAKFKF